MLDLKVHKYETISGTSHSRLVSETPYIVFSSKGLPDIYLQAGIFYYSDGSEVMEVPEEITQQYRKLSKEAKDVYGIGLSSKITGEKIEFEDRPLKPLGRPPRKIDEPGGEKIEK